MSDDFRDPSDSDESVRAIDRLAQLAREAEPPKLSAVETDALVAAVLARRREPARVDSMPPSLRDEPLTAEERELAQPDPLDDERSSSARDMRDGVVRAGSVRDGSVRDGAAVQTAAADGAVREGAAREAAREGAVRDGAQVERLANRRAETSSTSDGAATRLTRRIGSRAMSFAAAAVLALGLAGGFVIGRREVDPNALSFEGPPSRVTLPSGDAIVATSGASLTLVHANDEMRSLEVREGTVLFDVAPLAPGERFVVEARGVRTEVRGTVFSVDADARVRVYEGSVSVEHEGASELVTAGRMWVDGEVRARDEGPLEAEGLDAAARRERAAGALAVRDVREETVELAVGAGVGTDVGSDAEASNDTTTNDAANDTHETGANDTGANETALDALAIGRVASAGVTRTDTAHLEAAEHRAPTGTTPSRATRETSVRDRRSNEDTRITPDVLARWIAEGDAERALVEARRRGWRLPEADALRALRRWDEALTIYERLAGRDGYAAFTGARVASQELGDRTRALALLERAPVSAFDERALGLRVRLLVEGGRRAEALPLAARYVARFPNGSLAEWMRALPDAE